jgi:hypothetical protein
MSKQYRVNNLRLRFVSVYSIWKVVAPNGIVLEEFVSDRDAVLWMQDTHDYLTPQGRKRKYGY